MTVNNQPTLPTWLAIILTLAMVIIIREGCVEVCGWLNIASAANIVGMIIMFLLLMAWRLTVGLPSWLTQASNTLLVDSGFAFLPVSAGAGLLLFALGDELWGIIITILISTLLPLWGLALLTDRWLKSTASPSTIEASNSVISNTLTTDSIAENPNASSNQEDK